MSLVEQALKKAKQAGQPQPLSTHPTAAQADAALEGFYPAVARLIGAQPGEIAFVENATRAWDLAFYSLDFRPGDRILTCVSEYSSNYISYLQVAKKSGAAIVVVPDDRLREETRAMALEVADNLFLVSLGQGVSHHQAVNPVQPGGTKALRIIQYFLFGAGHINIIVRRRQRRHPFADQRRFDKRIEPAVVAGQNFVR